MQASETSDGWSDAETLLLLDAVRTYHERWYSVAAHVGTKNAMQVGVPWDSRGGAGVSWDSRGGASVAWDSRGGAGVPWHLSTARLNSHCRYLSGLEEIAR